MMQSVVAGSGVPEASLMSLGCAKNLVDSEMMVSQLRSLGFEMSPILDRAVIIVVNTCGFLESAVEESIQAVLEAASYKEKGMCGCLVVAGCMVQRYGKKLLPLMPEVDLFLGTSHFHYLEDAILAWQKDGEKRLWIGPPRHLFDSNAQRGREMDSPSAYLKIAEGCSNRCSFCLIPRLRGPCRSRTVEDVVKEAVQLAAEGVREINLIAQDTTSFGLDRGDGNGLISLLEALETGTAIEWIRLLYCYPDRITDGLLRSMAESRRITPYLDIPFQHCVPKVLEAMGRRGSSCHAENVLENIRSHLPHAALRTTLMVGFPGETESDFKELVHFVEREEFEHLGVFTFSSEVGSRAAGFPEQVDREVAEERREIIMEIQRGISRKKLMAKVGRILPVLVEGYHPETEMLLCGRLPSQAPEVDGLVIITEGEAEIGEILPARITDAHDYDVEAKLIGAAERGFISV